MPVKLLMTWDIKPEHEQEYFEFVVREFIPGLQRLGAELSDAWATVYGGGPQIMVGAVLPNLNKTRALLCSPDWESLYDRLLAFVQNYQQKVVESMPGFQL
jgi:hypothetical protein